MGKEACEKAKGKGLSIEDRMIIQAYLHDSRTLTRRAARLDVSKSTISRDISKFSYIKQGARHLCVRRERRFALCNGCRKSGFFTNPYKSTDKSECERNHEFFQYVIQKGKNLYFLTQERVDEIFSNINSYIRESKGNSTPYDLVLRKYGKAFLDAVGIRRIPNKKVKLLQIV